MDNQIYNPQSTAVLIEHILRNHGLAQYGDADKIRMDPLGFVDTVLSVYEKQSKENEKRAADFWGEYEGVQHLSLDEMGNELSNRLYEGIRALFE